MSRPPNSPRRGIWTAPVAVGAVTAIGLLTALLTEGALAHLAAWVAVAAPLLVLLTLALQAASKARTPAGGKQSSP